VEVACDQPFARVTYEPTTLVVGASTPTIHERAVEGVRNTGRAEVVYNCRVAEYHTYFVGCEGWGFSVWAHNSYTPVQNAGRLTFDPATRSWRSTGGLVYGQGAAQGNRVLHVLEHLTPDPLKPLHTLFNVPRNQIIGLLDEAWAARQGAGVLQANGNRVFDIPMGRVVGAGGETSIRIIVRDGTTNVITAFPVP